MLDMIDLTFKREREINFLKQIRLLLFLVPTPMTFRVM